MAIYLDHNATSVPLDEAVQAMIPWLNQPANASSVHQAGRRARAAVERTRRAVGQSIGAERPSQITFTSGATEALHLAIVGSVGPGQSVVISAVEHPAVRGACEVSGAEVITVPVDRQGRLTAGQYADAVREDTALVVIMGAQNEIGVLYPVAEIVEAVAPVPVLCDGAQLWGRVPIDVKTLGVTMLALSGHKVGAPQGVGALWTRRGHLLEPHQRGGPQERGLRGGTESVAGLVGLGVAAERIPARIEQMSRVAELRDQLQQRLLAAVPGVIIHGVPGEGLPNTLAFRIDGVPGDVVLAALDLEGVYISSGSACSSGSVEPSPVLTALGLDPESARSGLRISLGPETTAEEIEQVMHILPEVIHRIRAASEDEF
ncbi:MAG: cysteine desulfurase family protein [Bradymonadia bacterium]